MESGVSDEISGVFRAFFGTMRTVGVGVTYLLYLVAGIMVFLIQVLSFAYLSPYAFATAVAVVGSMAVFSLAVFGSAFLFRVSSALSGEREGNRMRSLAKYSWLPWIVPPIIIYPVIYSFLSFPFSTAVAISLQVGFGNVIMGGLVLFYSNRKGGLGSIWVGTYILLAIPVYLYIGQGSGLTLDMSVLLLMMFNLCVPYFAISVYSLFHSWRSLKGMLHAGQ
ncbi:MAG: hypothetical protein M1515_03530 [Candidatus Thermoplasmatota archaeon]|jgi:hypothetical protein|nr:hypothetical protein [Candidatus Thermoplasmatota archaeon]